MGRLYSSYRRLFEPEVVETDKEIRRSDGFLEHWGWIVTLDEIAGEDYTKWDVIMKWSVVRFLNTVAFHKDKKQWQQARKERG